LPVNSGPNCFIKSAPGTTTGDIAGPEFRILLRHGPAAEGSRSTVKLKLNVFLCHPESGVCTIDRRLVHVFADASSKSESREECASLAINLAK
jgi:hypothetical protein